MNEIPFLTLVGAGPGDPDLITVKGVKALRNANAVLYDSLVDPKLLRYAPNAVHVPVGKRSGKSSISQSTIHQLIVEYAMKYGHVVRLKGGDPFVFARGIEELEYAEKHGIQTKVVIGISSIMLPGYYGIPLTKRGINQSFMVVTATTSEGTLSKDVAIAAEYSPLTLFFMGLKKMDLIIKEYQKVNKGNLPVAVINGGSIKNKEEVIYGTVNTILNQIQMINLSSPTLLLFGQCVAEAGQLSLENLPFEIKKYVA